MYSQSRIGEENEKKFSVSQYAIKQAKKKIQSDQIEFFFVWHSESKMNGNEICNWWLSVYIE